MKTPKSSLPPLKTLPAFLAVAKHLSFTKAAQELHVTHSAVSQSIRALEAFLGTPLLIRGSQWVALTEQGQTYFWEVQEGMQRIREATQKQLGDLRASVLTLNLSTALMMRWLIPRLPQFQSEYPAIDLRLSSLEGKFDFNRNRIDVGIAYGEAENWPYFYNKKLFSDQLILVGSPKIIPKTHSVDSMIRRLKAVYVDAAIRREDWTHWCKKAGIPEPDESRRVYFQNSAQALQAVASGVGIMVTHQLFVVDDIQSGQLRLVSDILFPMRPSYYLICPKENLKLPKIHLLCDWLIQEAYATNKKLV